MKRRTIEFCRCETGNTKDMENHETLNESPCFALGSNDLLDVAVKNAKWIHETEFSRTTGYIPLGFYPLEDEYSAKIGVVINQNYYTCDSDVFGYDAGDTRTEFRGHSEIYKNGAPVRHTKTQGLVCTVEQIIENARDRLRAVRKSRGIERLS